MPVSMTSNAGFDDPCSGWFCLVQVPLKAKIWRMPMAGENKDELPMWPCAVLPRARKIATRREFLDGGRPTGTTIKGKANSRCSELFPKSVALLLSSLSRVHIRP